MIMKFSQLEVVEIIKAHMIEKMQISPEAMESICFRCVTARNTGLPDLESVELSSVRRSGGPDFTPSSLVKISRP